MDYFSYGKILRQFIKTPEKYVTTGHERDAETGLDYRGARFYDGDVGRFLSLDPLAAEFAELSAYCYVAGNPIIFIDPDGKSFIGTDEEKVKLGRKKGKIIIKSDNATDELKKLIEIINETGSKTAIKQVLKTGRNRSRVHVKIDDETTDNGLLGLHQAHDKNGNLLEWNNDKGDFDGTPKYVKGTKGVYKEATITIYTANIRKNGFDRKLNTIAGVVLGFEQLVAKTFQHEAQHNTDKKFIKDLRKKREGKKNKNIGAHDAIYPQQNQVVKELGEIMRQNVDLQ